ncbi:MAG: hypothetical protein WCJ30_00690 [Deltaproteobacteria bacterium]
MRGERVAVGWVVPPQHGHGGDDAAGAELSFDGAVTRIIDAEQRSTISGSRFSPQEIERVTPIPGRGESFDLQADMLERAESGVERITCGAATNIVSDPGSAEGSMDYESSAADLEASAVPAYGAMYFCRTVAADRPFIFGLRGEADSSGLLRPFAEYIATRSGDVVHAPRVWRVPIDASAVVAARAPVARLRREAPDALDVVQVPGSGFAVALRFSSRLYVGWLTDELRPNGELMRVDTLGGEPGKPRLAARSGEALLVFADRPPTPRRVRGQPAPIAPFYALRAVRLIPAAPPGAPQLIDTQGDVTSHTFAPSIQTLPDGSWLFTWSRGELDLGSGPAAEGSQAVFFRRYLADLTPAGEVTPVIVGENVSDSRLAVRGDHFVMTLMAGRSTTRHVVAVSGRCDGVGGI